MRRDAVVALVSYCPVTGDEPDRLEKTHAKMTAHVAEAAAQRAEVPKRRSSRPISAASVWRYASISTTGKLVTRCAPTAQSW